MNTPTDTTIKLKMDINRRREVDEMHLMDAEAEDEAFCKVDVSVHDLTGVQDYADRRPCDSDSLRDVQGSRCSVCREPMQES